MQTSDMSATFHTFHTSHTPRTTHRTTHTTHKPHHSHASTHHISPTTRAFAVARLPCFLDKELRSLKDNSEDASYFCPLYLAHHSHILLPDYVSQFEAPQIRSACSCFDRGDDTARSTAPAVMTEAESVLTSTAPSSSTTASSSYPSRPSSGPSTSTARGSVTRGDRSGSAAIASPGRLAIVLVWTLVTVPVMALLIGA